MITEMPNMGNESLLSKLFSDNDNVLNEELTFFFSFFYKNNGYSKKVFTVFLKTFVLMLQVVNVFTMFYINFAFNTRNVKVVRKICF